jgi:molecular chaperone Hsp33
VDQLVRATAAAGGIRAVAVITTQLTEEARQRHKLSYVATAALGRTMTAGLLLASNMKQATSHVNIQISGDGPLGGIQVDAGLDGTVRGYVSHPDVELPLNPHGQLDVGKGIGQGYLNIMRDVGYGTPYSGTVELISGEIAEDIAHYLVTSEQIPSALITGVYVNPDGVVAAGGLLIQLLPQVEGNQPVIDALENRISRLSEFTPMLKSGYSLHDILEALLGDMGIHVFPDTQVVKFQCRCSFDRVLGALKLLGVAELQDMLQTDGKAEATCHFCNEVYQASRDQLAALIEEMGEAARDRN